VGAKRPLKKTEKRRRPKKVKKKTFFARRVKTIFKQKCSYLRPLLSITFPQGFRISKNVKRYLKSEQTDKQTDTRTNTQTDISTYRKHRPRGPMLWKSRNLLGKNKGRNGTNHGQFRQLKTFMSKS
jgi:hypothetical protein